MEKLRNYPGIEIDHGQFFVYDASGWVIKVCDNIDDAIAELESIYG